ncbi:MAG: phosphoadenylyl-sulfate reductase [Jatrophihabitans sp.]
MTTQTKSLRELADRAAIELADAPAVEVIGWAAETFGARFAIAASMQDGVLPHLARRAAPSAALLFLDTGYHFAETIATRDRVARDYGLTVLNLTAQKSVSEQDAEFGARLHDRDPDLCCALRKTAPLDVALDDYDAWATGVRRVEAPTRASTAVIGYDEKRDTVKISPLAAWSDQDLADYIAEYDVIVNPLLHQGYPSIGCAPCTRAVRPGEDPRSGRWSDTVKTECGIHL